MSSRASVEGRLRSSVLHAGSQLLGEHRSGSCREYARS